MACTPSGAATRQSIRTRFTPRFLSAFTVAMGNQTTLALRAGGVADHFSHVSAGDRAALHFLRGDELLGLAALES